MMVWDYGDIYIGGRVTVSSIPTDITNWHHYVYVVSQSGNIKKTYLDGVANSSNVYSQSCINKNFPFFIGGTFSDGTSSKIMWTGKIDDVSIYNRALNANEVSALYNATSICASTVGIKELQKASELLVCPTVSMDGTFSIMNDNFESAKVFGMDGRFIRSFSSKEVGKTIDLGTCNAGVYFLVVKSGDYYFTQKIIVN